MHKGESLHNFGRTPVRGGVLVEGGKQREREGEREGAREKERKRECESARERACLPVLVHLIKKSLLTVSIEETK